MYHRARPFNIWGRSRVVRSRILVIHHTADTHAEQANIIESSHAARGYDESNLGSHIAYHFLIGKDGTIKQNRNLSERSGHTLNSVINLESIAIVVAGNFQKEKPTPQQLASLRSLVMRLDSIYHFDRIIPHADASPTACPGAEILVALKDLWRALNVDIGVEVWYITRYYTPVRGQNSYFRSVTSTAQMLENAIEFKVVRFEKGHYVHYNETPAMTFTAAMGKTKEEAIAFIDKNSMTKYLIKREVEYQMDFKVNCSVDCFVTADGYRLQPQDAFKVLACPPEIAFGTKIDIEGIGTFVCHDRGGAIKEKRLDVWAGSGDEALAALKNYPGGYLTVKIHK